MRSELFEKWYSDLCEKLNVDYCLAYLEDKGRYFKTQTHVAYTAWQHRQTEVDELQKRVDAALDQVEYFKSHLDSEQKGFAALILKELEQALKGGGE
ncbi:hypothetical protein [Acinetobacter courvalinii]|uniref:hypothetical protein n=1 Tax=Acinetobacter courvalinii TaxID=280147 RepID=UPI00289794F3|nr:hypothetical protein [Acinetobacter courvalinii]